MFLVLAEEAVVTSASAAWAANTTAAAVFVAFSFLAATFDFDSQATTISLVVASTVSVSVAS
ncbi:MAG: hypothetical protein FWH05_04820 [Oscillospiraceae bacterium]|nr:hypothetical protein [Oscillospiraceae bacterium]